MTRLTAEVAEASAGPVGPPSEEHTHELSSHPLTRAPSAVAAPVSRVRIPAS
jgi:hypothetical protein